MSITYSGPDSRLCVYCCLKEPVSSAVQPSLGPMDPAISVMACVVIEQPLLGARLGSDAHRRWSKRLAPGVVRTGPRLHTVHQFYAQPVRFGLDNGAPRC